MAKSWERQSDETEPAFEAFRIYLDIGSGRTQEETRKILGKTYEVINKWAVENNWNKRAIDYDNWINREIDKKLVNEAWKTKKEHTKLYSNLRNIAQFPIGQLAKRIENLNDKDKNEILGMSLKQLIAFSNESIKLLKDLLPKEAEHHGFKQQPTFNITAIENQNVQNNAILEISQEDESKFKELIKVINAREQERRGILQNPKRSTDSGVCEESELEHIYPGGFEG